MSYWYCLIEDSGLALLGLGFGLRGHGWFGNINIYYYNIIESLTHSLSLALFSFSHSICVFLWDIGACSKQYT